MRIPDDALAHAPVFLSLLDVQGTLVWASRITYGLNPDLIGQPADVPIAVKDRPVFWERFRRARDLREVANFTLHIEVPAAPGFVKLVGRLAPVIYQDQVAGVVAVSWDATFQGEPAAAARFMFDDLGRAVVRTLLADGAMKGAAIGAALGHLANNYQARPKLRAVLAQLCERGILTHGPAGYTVSDGFRLIADQYLG